MLLLLVWLKTHIFTPYSFLHYYIQNIADATNKLTIHTNTRRLYREYVCARLLQDLCGDTYDVTAKMVSLTQCAAELF